VSKVTPRGDQRIIHRLPLRAEEVDRGIAPRKSGPPQAATLQLVSAVRSRSLRLRAERIVPCRHRL